MRSYKHIIWDWNGTLLDDTALCVDVLNGLLTARGRDPIGVDDYRLNFGFPVIHFYEFLGFDTDRDSFASVSQAFISAYESRWLDEVQLHPQASETLGALRAAGLTHSVLSAAHQDALEFGIRHFGLAEHFTGLAGTDNIFAMGKEERGRAWVAGLPWHPSEIALVGDTLHDLEVARAIGTDCILVGHGHHTPERLEHAGVPLVHSLKELRTHLRAEAVPTQA